MSVGLFRFNWCNWKEHHVRALHIKQFFSFRTGTFSSAEGQKQPTDHFYSFIIGRFSGKH